ncbi:phosphodiester glycosidase family protein [Paenisporosarcina cavernae]|uniref:Phosphodiester glycosidase family protein n=1 Tax=Paenisporosarcina cavernae TaxID=2320858 RepID=A0A385YQQ9_9BACL|nr:phosphodiester glycosidase family protein [Paenisporosarcina cavernae]AYC28926.1 phosphodiester glycosidase family protein [Paenisporosarcina cavernae]
MRIIHKFFLVVIVLILSFSASLPTLAATISQGVYHQAVSTTTSGYPQKINTLSVNMNQPFTTIDVGTSNPLTTLRSVSSLSQLDTRAENHVVGAVNASFFDYDSRTPNYFLAEGDQILNLGRVSTNYNDFMYTPAAFGVTPDNKGKIAPYDLSLTIEHNGIVSDLTSYNRERNPDESILFTKSWSYSTTRTNATGLEVVVVTNGPVDSGRSLGQPVEGKVTSIRAYGDPNPATIPTYGYVISAVGKAEVDKIRDLKVNDAITLTMDVDAAWDNSKFMLASGPLLVQDGKVNISMDLRSPRATERTAHTAVATDATGSRVFFVTVDGRQSGYSQGMTLPEFANYLVSLGVVQAINLDGGGSTTMVTRKYGDVYPSLVNRPSDGRERSVSAILEAISTAPYGTPTHFNSEQTEAGILAVGATVGFRLNYVLDQYYNALPVDPAKLKLVSVSNGIAEIEGNVVRGVKAGTGTVQATYDGAPVSFPLTVTDQIDQLIASPTSIRTGTGETASVKVKGISKNQQVIFNPQAVNWTVSGGVGSLNGTTFTAGNVEGKGAIVGSFGTTKVSIPVTVSNQAVDVSSFESTTSLSTEAIRGTATLKQESTLQAQNGAKSVKLSYDFTGSDGTSAAYLKWNTPYLLEASPKKLGMWVYGDGSSRWLRGSLLDVNGKEIVIDFTDDEGLNWSGWKYVEAEIPTSAQAPLKVQRIYLAELASNQKTKGEVWFDGLQAIYSISTPQPDAFSADSAARFVAKDKEFTITFNQEMNTSFQTSKFVYVEDQKGNRQAVTVSKGTTSNKLVVKAPTGGYASGKNYRLVVTHLVKNNRGTRMVKDSITQFNVK